MKYCILPLFLCLNLAVFAQRQGGIPSKITISGKVIDQETQQPLEYATITFTNPKRPDLVQGGITDAKGKKLITPQEHMIGRVQNKEEEWTEDLRIPAGESRHYDFQFNISPRKRSGTALLRLSLKREGQEDTTIWDLPVDVH